MLIQTRLKGRSFPLYKLTPRGILPIGLTFPDSPTLTTQFPLCLILFPSSSLLSLSRGNMSLIFSQALSNHALSLKVILISTTVLSAAVALKISVPVIADFAVTDAPSIYNSVISWLKPPYLYLVINCIIISIVASSKLQSKIVESESSPTSVSHHHQLERAPIPVSDQIQVHTPILSPIKHYSYGDFLVNGEEVEAVRSEDFRFENDSLNTEVNYKEITVWENVDEKELIESKAADVLLSTKAAENSNNADESVSLLKSSWSPSPLIRRDSSEFSDLNEKPLVSARFGHRRSVKGSPEGGKTALRVSKSKKQETIETTWKTITEGRAIPLARHLKKSDTWESRGGGGGGGRHHQIQALPPHDPRTMEKAETFHNRNSSSSNSLQTSSSPGAGGGGGSGKLKREASLSQDELNKRVEAFIKKFNEEMRLQRQESLSQYAEMMGAH